MGNSQKGRESPKYQEGVRNKAGEKQTEVPGMAAGKESICGDVISTETGGKELGKPREIS